MLTKKEVNMKKLLITTLSLVLAGCGGGSSDDSTQQQEATNNPPSLVGQLTLETKAMSSASFTLDMKDDDNDTLTLAIANQPEWLTLTTNGTEATLKVEPDFFDIGEYTFQAILSDGHASKDYQLTITINDDPSKWQKIKLSSSELAGIWSTSDEKTKFIFGQNNAGAHILNNELTSFDYQVSSEGDIALTRYGSGVCYSYCNISDLTVVASDNESLRVHFKNETEEHVLNLHVQDLAAVTPSYLTDEGSYPSENISVVGSDSHLYSYLKVDTGNGSFSRSVKVTGKLSNNQITADSNSQLFQINFYNMKTGLYETLELAVNINAIDILYSDDKFFFAEQSHSTALLTDLGTYNTEDFQGLDKALSNQTNLIIQEKIAPISVPDLNSGSIYTGRLLSSEFETEDGTLRANPVFKVNTQTEFSVTSYFPHQAEKIETVLTINNDGEKLSYSYDNNNYSAKFFQKANGDIFLAQNNEGFYQGSLFSEVNSSNTIKYEDVIGLYIDPSLSNSDSKEFFAFTEDERSLFSSSTTGDLPELNTELETDNFWTIKNNRILVINNFSCPSASSYESCISESEATEDGGVFFRSLEYLGEYNNSTLYNYSYFYRMNGETKGSGFQALKLLQKQ